MMEKHWVKSKTIWGAIASLISFVALLFISHSAEDRYFALTGIVSSIGTIYGRLVAKHKLVLKEKKDG